jgi:Tfp pilus assembly protein PilN
MIAGRPLKAGVLAGKLNRHGITASAARNTARRTLAANLPATILADLADINISTAIQWTRQAKTDWTTYIADRAANAQHEREKWYPSN